MTLAQICSLDHTFFSNTHINQDMHMGAPCGAGWPALIWTTTLMNHPAAKLAEKHCFYCWIQLPSRDWSSFFSPSSWPKHTCQKKKGPEINYTWPLCTLCLKCNVVSGPDVSQKGQRCYNDKTVSSTWPTNSQATSEIKCSWMVWQGVFSVNGHLWERKP